MARLHGPAGGAGRARRRRGADRRGHRLKDDIEDATDRLALSAFDALDDDELELLFRTLTPITRTVIAGGDIPAATPMGLRRDDLDDDGATWT